MWTSLSTAALLALSTLQATTAHTWIDCIDTDRSVVYDNARKWIYGGTSGNGLCRGYMKNYPGRGDADINTKMTFKILMEDVPKGVPVCTPGAADYSGWRKRIQVKAGEKFYYAYTDNGHVAKDKAGRGTFYGVYWTGAAGTNLEKTTDLTQDKLIDGKLYDFDDGNCGQTFEDGDFSGNVLSGRAGNDYPCVGNMQMPAGTKPGVYNLVWFWKFYNDKVNAAIKTTGGSYGGAAYSSCFQVEVIAGGAPGQNDSPLSPVKPANNEAATVPPTPKPAPPPPAPAPPAPAPAPQAPTPAPASKAPAPPTPTPTPAVPDVANEAALTPKVTPAVTTMRPKRKDCHA
jgi:hypothetical protein